MQVFEWAEAAKIARNVKNKLTEKTKKIRKTSQNNHCSELCPNSFVFTKNYRFGTQAIMDSDSMFSQVWSYKL